MSSKPESITAGISFKLLYATHELFFESSNQTGVKAWLHRNITCRGGYLLGTLILPLTSTVDLALGSVAAIGSIVTGGYFTPLNRAAYKMTGAGGNGLISVTYLALEPVQNLFKVNDDCIISYKACMI